MDNSIDELFSVILNSEKVVLDEKKKCKEVKEKTEIVRLRLEKQTETKRECTQKIERLTDGLFHSKFGIKLMKSKEEFLTKKLSGIQSEVTSNTEKLDNLNTAFERSTKTFMLLVQDFSNNYSISSNGKEARESKAKATIKMLATMVDALKNELQTHHTRNQKLSAVVKRLQEIKQLKTMMENQRQECENQIEMEELEILKLQKQRHQLETLPDTDESFVTLNNELEQYQTGDLEMKVNDLQSELNQLMLTAGQKESHKLRQQYRQWQRQRQQMLHNEKQSRDKQLSNKPATNKKTANTRTHEEDDGHNEDKTVTEHSQEMSVC